MIDEELKIGTAWTFPNLELSFGDSGEVTLLQTVKKTIVNRFKYWMLCKFFPFKIKSWDA